MTKSTYIILTGLKFSFCLEELVEFEIVGTKEKGVFYKKNCGILGFAEN